MGDPSIFQRLPACRTQLQGAGFDGVEPQSAYGNLVDQFLQDVTNQRSDDCGGSVENRARFLTDITEKLIESTGDSKKDGVRFSPFSACQGMLMEDPIPQFLYATEQLMKLNLASSHLTESPPSSLGGGARYEEGIEGHRPFIDAWGSTGGIILASDSTLNKAKYFISTPDLAFRVRNNMNPNEWDQSNFYKPGFKSYADYPFSKEFLTQTES